MSPPNPAVSPGPTPRYLVVQMGARRGYAVPAILEKAGLLERFYTDFCADVGLGRWLAAGRHLPGVGGRFARLAGRRLPPEIRSKTRTFAAPFLGRFVGRRPGDATVAFRESMRQLQRWSEALKRAGLGQATHLFSMLNEAGYLLGYAKERGVKVVCEIYILLDTENILARERREFPGWEPAVAEFDAVRREFPDDRMLANSDLLLCPSEAVRADLVTRLGVSRERTALVPYGMDPRWLSLGSAPRPGRVLFVGTAELRKGIHYLAMAAERLARRGLPCEFRVAGHVTDAVRAQPVCRHLTFLGRVPREHIAAEFQAADVFVLPSLAEGSAEVTYEALASGLPVVTTAASGSVARDGIEGRIVPERDAAALADAIAEIVEDRDRRERMSVAARARARDFTWEEYGRNLLTALQVAAP